MREGGKIMFMSLAGRAAIVTGAAQGIGRAIAARLAEAGAGVLIADVNEEKAQAAATDLRVARAEGEVHAVRADVTRPEEVDAMVALALRTFGQVDILVNNAGIAGRAAPLWELADDDWNRVLALNLTG